MSVSGMLGTVRDARWCTSSLPGVSMAFYASVAVLPA